MTPTQDLFCVSSPPSPHCRAIAIIPARNEADSLPRALDALRKQQDGTGRELSAESYEVLVLLNNCTDDTVAIVDAYRVQHPEFRLLVVERKYAADRAHVGTARREAMEIACERLEQSRSGFAILSTDADSVCAPDWVAQNLRCLEEGADAVGGDIQIFADELDSLEPDMRQAYERDARYQAVVARLESLLDPDPFDPWPRHLQHFGASLACTREIYRRVGGMPAVAPLEDVAFVNALRKADARLRHSLSVRVSTSARLDGRAPVGLSGQLRHWQEQHRSGLPHQVESAAWLEHRFRTLGMLRAFNQGRAADTPIAPEDAWRKLAVTLQAERLSNATFLEKLDCDRWTEKTFARCYPGARRYVEILTTIDDLSALTETHGAARVHPI